MDFLLRLLVDPGRSLAGYVLRVAPIMLAGAYIAAFIGALIPITGAYDFGTELASAPQGKFVALVVLVGPAIETVVLAIFVRATRMMFHDIIAVGFISGIAAGILHLPYGPSGFLSATWGSSSWRSPSRLGIVPPSGTVLRRLSCFTVFTTGWSCCSG